MGLFREKLEALNQISVFIAERFETTTEEQIAFFKTPLIIRYAGIFIPTKLTVFALRVPFFF
jgi:hypothetical protein